MKQRRPWHDALMVIGVEYERDGEEIPIKFSRRSVSAGFDTQFFFRPPPRDVVNK